MHNLKTVLALLERYFKKLQLMSNKSSNYCKTNNHINEQKKSHTVFLCHLSRTRELNFSISKQETKSVFDIIPDFVVMMVIIFISELRDNVTQAKMFTQIKTCQYDHWDLSPSLTTGLMYRYLASKIC